MTPAAVSTKQLRRKVRRRGNHAGRQQKLDSLLSAAAALIAEKGFEATSMRDVARATRASLSGLYHYAASKEELLYQIQYRTFASLLAAQQKVAAEPGTAEERLRRLIVGHLAFYQSHRDELKVCTYELESLNGKRYRTTEELRRQYYLLMARVLEELMRERGNGPQESRVSRHTALYIFGMLNWIFMWYDPDRYGSVEKIGEEMIDLVLHGVRGRAKSRRIQKHRVKKRK